MSDHSVLTAEIEMFDQPCTNAHASADLNESARQCNEALPDTYPRPPKRYRKGNLPSDFMSNEEKLASCSDLISRLLDEKLEQESMDKAYEDIVSLYHSECQNS